MFFLNEILLEFEITTPSLIGLLTQLPDPAGISVQPTGQEGILISKILSSITALSDSVTRTAFAGA